MDLLHYLDEHGADPFQDRLDGLTDQKARLAVYQRVGRLISGNLGDHKACRSGIWELRIDVGPGYRVYFARPLHETVLVLNGGDKRRQRRDIQRAIAYWADYQRRVKRLRQ
jgi:putative addiction module killer protein